MEAYDELEQREARDKARREATNRAFNDLMANRPNDTMEILQARSLVLKNCVELFQGGHGTVTVTTHRGDDIVYHVVKGENPAYRCDCRDYQSEYNNTLGSLPLPQCMHATAVEIYTLADLAE